MSGDDALSVTHFTQKLFYFSLSQLRQSTRCKPRTREHTRIGRYNHRGLDFLFL